MELLIRPVTQEDYPACAAIYRYYVAETTVSFEETPLSDAAFGQRADAIKAGYPYLVAEADGRVAGYAYLAPYSDRSAYRYTADVSIYLDRSAVGKGIGSALLTALEAAGRKQGLTRLLSLVTEENRTSKQFHARHGYRVVGTLQKVGFKQNKWLDVVFFQKDL